ncbi:hypothetical protein ACFWXH_10555 [Mesorhizobium sp. NPDC059054]|uniref:hypothetical protein n=1 Tax=Mesorhizobium sp. NPDC059054 TaxID=3346711 RepID=UPI00367594D7
MKGDRHERLFAIAGAKKYLRYRMVAPTNGVVLADFSGVTWIEIADWCGGYGDAAALITTEMISRGRDVKQKGAQRGIHAKRLRYGLQRCGPNRSDCCGKTRNYPFKILWDDAPGAAPSSATMTIASAGGITSDNHLHLRRTKAAFVGSFVRSRKRNYFPQ